MNRTLLSTGKKTLTICCCFLLLWSCGCLHAQNVPAKLLPVTVIGTETSVDYSNNTPSVTVNTKDNAFDSDLSTIFAAYERSGGWAGLDLGEAHVITKIAWCPRQGWAGRLLLGVFEGANKPDFGDAVPLRMITETPAEGTMTEGEVNCSLGFRYVRYVGPNDVRCNIAEIEFYGYPGEGDRSQLYQVAGLPLVVIHTVGAVDIADPYKEVYRKGIVSFISGNGTQFYTDSLEIKGRGNASWGFPKKPYRLKLFKKTNVFGLPANAKNWTLINNYGDKTLMRNLLAFDLSRRLELPYTPAGMPVNVFLNGEYKGCYQLCDHIEVGKGRVDIKEMEEDDTSLPKLSGGYLLEIDAYASSEISWFTSGQGVPVTIKSPKDDEIVPAQSGYIRAYFNEMETALFSAGYKNPVTGYRKYLDMETFIRHFLVGELSGNTDTYWSVYMYKDRNEDLFRFGPVWDFDIAFENDVRTYPINQNPNWIYASTGSEAANTRAMVNRLFTDAEFVARLKAVYAEYRDNGALTEDALLGVIDSYAAQLDDSQKLNFTRWNILNTTVHQNPRTYGSYEGETENVRTFVRERLQWMDRKLNYVPRTENPEDPETSAAETENFPEVYVWTRENAIYVEGISRTVRVEVIDTAGKTLFTTMTDVGTVIPSGKGLFIIVVSDKTGKRKTLKCAVP
ncbi:MAG: CotH kinase family protein [Bacteroidales bacterium]|nr:CotH kinase family protein [Bacteroidales bacterium]